MIEGTAASSSTAVPSGRRSHTGQVSVRNKAMPKASGTAISSAMPALTRVPTMAIAPAKLDAELVKRRPSVDEERDDDAQQRRQHQQRQTLRQPMEHHVLQALPP